MNIIDPHLHFFDLQSGEYQWLKSDNPPFWPDKHLIQQSFTPAHLTLNHNFSLKAVVHIEAGYDNRESWREISWLESDLFTQSQQKVNDSAEIAGKSIASINLTLTSCEFKRHIDKLISFSSLVGVRHILDDNAAQLLAMKQVQQNLIYLAQHSLIFECQFNVEEDLAVEHLHSLLTKAPQLKVIINHAGFANLAQPNIKYWQKNMAKLASHPHVFVKASGWEMVNRQYQIHDITQIVRVLINTFGVTRVMLASNFPLCLFSCSYAELWQVYYDLPIDLQEKEHLMYLNAKRIYNL